MEWLFRKQREKTFRMIMGDEAAAEHIARMKANRGIYTKRYRRVFIPIFAVFLVAQAILIPLTGDSRGPYSWAPNACTILFLVIVFAFLTAMLYKTLSEIGQAGQRRKIMVPTISLFLLMLAQFVVLTVAGRTHNFNLMGACIIVCILAWGVEFLFAFRSRARVAAKFAELRAKNDPA